MLLRIDHKAAYNARLITEAEYDDVRCCYLLDGAIIVVRSGYELKSLKGQAEGYNLSASADF